MPHSAQSQHANYWAPRTLKRHQQEHRPQRPTESSDPTQHAKGRTGDCPGPCKETTTRRNVTQGGGPRQQPAHPQYANYWAPLTRKRHTMPHSAQSQHANYWAPRTLKRHQQEHRPQRPTESSDPTQHAKGRTGDRPGPRKGATTRRNVTQGGRKVQWPSAPSRFCSGPRGALFIITGHHGSGRGGPPATHSQGVRGVMGTPSACGGLLSGAPPPWGMGGGAERTWTDAPPPKKNSPCPPSYGVARHRAGPDSPLSPTTQWSRDIVQPPATPGNAPAPHRSSGRALERAANPPQKKYLFPKIAPKISCP